MIDSQQNHKVGHQSTHFFIKILKTIVITILSTIPITMILLAKEFEQSTPANIQWGISIGIIIITLFLTYILFTYYKKHTQHPFKKIGWRDFGIALALYLLTRAIAVGGTLLNEYLTGASMSSNDAALDMEGSIGAFAFPMYLIIFQFLIAIGIPIIEELAFRGIFVDIWFKNQKTLFAAIITSAFFALAHGFDNLITFSMYFLMALVFYYAYARRWNLLDSILLHVLNNGIIVLATIALELL